MGKVCTLTATNGESQELTMDELMDMLSSDAPVKIKQIGELEFEVKLSDFKANISGIDVRVSNGEIYCPVNKYPNAYNGYIDDIPISCLSEQGKSLFGIK